MAGRDAEQFTDAGFGESSQYGAHLDRGWAMFDRGDLEAARTSVNHAQELRPEDPDALMLQGAIAVAEGKPEEGLRCYERAIELDPEFLDPYLTAASVCLFDLEDPARALRVIGEAEELDNLSPFEVVDLQLLAVECEWASGDEARARRRLHAISELSVVEAAVDLATSDAGPDAALDHRDPDRVAAAEFLALDHDGEPLDEEERHERADRLFQLAMRVARLRLDLSEPGPATDFVRELAERFPEDADAWYLLSEAEQRVGEPRRSALASLRTLQLDGADELPRWLPSAPVIHDRVRELIGAAPVKAIQDVLRGGVPLPILVQEQPSPELVAEGLDPRMPALALASRLYDSQGSSEGVLVLTGLTVYARNIARWCHDGEQFGQELRLSVLDELAVFLRLGDDDRVALGLPPTGMPPEADDQAPHPTLAPVAAAPEEDGEDKPKRRRGPRRNRNKHSN